MKRNLMILVVMATVFATTASAFAAMNAYLRLEDKPGNALVTNEPILGVKGLAGVAYDPNHGQPSGKRQYGALVVRKSGGAPTVIWKPVDSSSPLAMLEVSFSDGLQVHGFSYAFQDVQVYSVDEIPGQPDLEEVSFSYGLLTVKGTTQGLTNGDSWTDPTRTELSSWSSQPVRHDPTEAISRDLN